jgi:large subunit ribosomal protein L2
MARGKRKAVTPGTRFRDAGSFKEITKEKPEKKLTKARQRISGRNSYGRITMRRRGGGNKRRYRLIDFRREKFGIPARVVGVEYDPNRSARIALLQYADGEKRYIIAPNGLQVGQTLVSGPTAEIKVGNALALNDIPVGEVVHNIELRPGGGAVMCRSAGGQAQLMAKLEGYALLRLPSGEQRRVLLTCMATIGSIGNAERFNRSLGKAGATRWIGRRPKVRGVAMNPVDHPHGGGEGKTSGGRHPVTPWGLKTKGKKTRHNKRTDKFIVRRRK